MFICFVIEMQIMNSDGNLEPVGPADSQLLHEVAPRPEKPFSIRINARDLQDLERPADEGDAEIAIRRLRRWPYVELVTAVDARVPPDERRRGGVVIATTIECWGSTDRFFRRSEGQVVRWHRRRVPL